jgi:hypothetical protein
MYGNVRCKISFLLLVMINYIELLSGWLVFCGHLGATWLAWNLAGKFTVFWPEIVPGISVYNIKFWWLAEPCKAHILVPFFNPCSPYCFYAKWWKRNLWFEVKNRDILNDFRLRVIRFSGQNYLASLCAVGLPYYSYFCTPLSCEETSIFLRWWVIKEHDSYACRLHRKPQINICFGSSINDGFLK